MRTPQLAKLTASALIASAIVAGNASAAIDQWTPSSPGTRRGEFFDRTHSRATIGVAAVGAAVPTLMTYHNGPVMTTGADVTPIYWGKSWGTATFVGDKMTGLAAFYGGIGASKFFNTNIEYTQTVGKTLTPVLNKVTTKAAITDTSAGPKAAPTTTDVLNEVAAVLKKAKITAPPANAYYPVYGDVVRPTATTACGWHSSGKIGTVTVTFAFFYNLDGDAGCDPKSTIAGTSQGLAALANISAHELSETVTDPQLNAWYDATLNENSDKCAWTFSATPPTFGGRQWKLQGNWSNAAYLANTGYTNVATNTVMPGCIDTK